MASDEPPQKRVRSDPGDAVGPQGDAPAQCLATAVVACDGDTVANVEYPAVGSNAAVGSDAVCGPIRPRAAWKSAWQYCMEMQPPLRCGDEALDSQLNGGLTEGLWEVCGCVGAGKTRLCLSMLATLHTDLASFPGSRGALYLDTIGALAPHLVFGAPSRCYRVYCPVELVSVLREELKNCDGEQKKYRLAIVDSMAFPFRTELDFAERSSDLGIIEKLLRRVADVVLVTNHVSGPDSTPTLGKSWADGLDHRLLLENNTFRVLKSIIA